MHFPTPAFLLALLTLATPAISSPCNQDNCYRALARYQSTTSASAFCSQFLATPTKAIPGSIATCGPTRISSACSCLTPIPSSSSSSSSTPSSKHPTPTPTSSFNTSTCSRTSIAACPTPYNPCCRFICAEAQVPFDLCSPNDTTGQYASCSPCPSSAAVATAAP